jgi:hypothetical protein
MSLYTISADSSITKTRQLAYVDYFTSALKITNLVRGNNVRFVLTDQTKS